MGFFDIFKKKQNEEDLESEIEDVKQDESSEEVADDEIDTDSVENDELADESSRIEAMAAAAAKVAKAEADARKAKEAVAEKEAAEAEETTAVASDDEPEIDSADDEDESIADNDDSEELDEEPEEKLQQPAKEKKGLFRRLTRGLSKTSGKIVGGMESIFMGKKVIDEDLLDELEELFITADIGVNTAIKIIEEVRDEVSRKVLNKPEDLKEALKEKLFNILNVDNSLIQTDDHPYVVLVIGVNGAGKTTSIAKLANMFKNEGLKTMLAAGDTFRAAAVDQLKIWADRVGVPVVSQAEGSDPAAVIFDAVQSAKAKKYDVLIADTAGRLHTKFNLMNELEKVVRVMKRELPDAPHEFLLVLDATSGQNAINQAKAFSEAVGATGIILTKLDGTAKGGVIVGIVDELNIPVKFIGFGEGMEDLRPFDARDFVDALFGDEEE